MFYGRYPELVPNASRIQGRDDGVVGRQGEAYARQHPDATLDCKTEPRVARAFTKLGFWGFSD